MKEAIILAGGFGTRLQGVLSDLPKPMAPVHDRPFLSYLLDYLITYQYEHVVLSTGYLHEKIESFYGHQYRNLKISYAQERTPLGTGGALRYALSKCQSDNVLVLNGDTLFKVDLFAFEAFFDAHVSLLSIVLREVEDVQRYGSVKVNGENRIVLFSEKGCNSGRGFINGGVYMVNKMLFTKYLHPEKFSFEKEIMERYYMEEKFFGMLSKGYFIDIGIPEDYSRAMQELY